MISKGIDFKNFKIKKYNNNLKDYLNIHTNSQTLQGKMIKQRKTTTVIFSPLFQIQLIKT